MKRSVKKGNIGEEKVISLFSTIKDEHYLINNLILIGDNGVSHQFDHILIRHNGVFVIETKNYYGTISGNKEDNMWTKTYYKRGKLVTEKFMNPIKQNNAHIRCLKKLLGKDIPFINFVVFVDNDVSSLSIYNACDINNILIRIYSWEIDTPLSSKEMKSINDKLLLLEADIQSEDHVKNVKSLKKDRLTEKKESILVMEKGICPICGNKITMDKNIYFCKKCRYQLKV